MAHYNRLTVRVIVPEGARPERDTRLGWEGGLAVETEKLKARKLPQKRGAYPPSAARRATSLA